MCVFLIHKLLVVATAFSKNLYNTICYKITFYLFDAQLYKQIKHTHPIIFKQNRSFPNDLLLKERVFYGLHVAYNVSVSFLRHNNIKKAILIRANYNFKRTRNTHMVLYYKGKIYDSESFFRYTTNKKFLFCFYTKNAILKI